MGRNLSTSNHGPSQPPASGHGHGLSYPITRPVPVPRVKRSRGLGTRLQFHALFSMRTHTNDDDRRLRRANSALRRQRWLWWQQHGMRKAHRRGGGNENRFGYLSLNPGRHEGTEQKQHVSVHSASRKCNSPVNSNSEPRHPIFASQLCCDEQPLGADFSCALSHRSVYFEPRYDEAKRCQLSLEATYQPGEVIKLKISQSNTGNCLQ